MDNEIINCQNKFNKTNANNNSSDCEPIWDGVYCWPPTSPNTTIRMKCSDIFAVTIGHSQHYSSSDGYIDYFAYRKCSENRGWDWNNWTNYTECLTLLTLQDEDGSKLTNIKQILNYIVLTCSICSLVALIIALIIFICFKALQCPRIRVHKNLCIALLMNCCLMIIMSSPVVVNNESLPQIDWLCKCLKSLNIYSSMATIYWMFIEGLLLHTRLYVSPFKNKNPSFIVFNLIGWIFPALCVIVWSLVLEFGVNFGSRKCWQGYGHSKSIFIISAPIMLALSINTGFLINIIRILFVKLKNDSNKDKATIKAIKAAALLIPLFGIQHLIFCINPATFNIYLESVYIIINGLIQSVQGITVSILYCFTNIEVRSVLNSAWSRRRLSHLIANSHNSKKRRQSNASTTDTSLNNNKISFPLFPNNNFS